MSSWVKGVEAITLFVEDLEATGQFYRKVFGAPVVYEDENSVAFKFESTIVNLLQMSQVDELIAPATAGAGPRFVLTLAVDDVDAKCAELAALGVPLLNGPMDRPWGIRTASFLDPAGHIWEIAK